jgi:Fe-S-cluster-containing hydrogenase component 2
LKVAELVRVGPNAPLLPEMDEETGKRSAPTPVVYVLEGEARVHAEVYGVPKTLSWVQRREFFYHRTYTEQERETLQLVSMSPVVGVTFPARELDGILQGNPAMKAGFTQQLQEAAQRRERYFADPARAAVSSFVVEERLTPTNRVKILRHDLCVECDGCYEACAERHGVSRLWPSDTRFGVVSIPANCHNCYYPTCEPACKFDVLRYDPNEPELRVSHDCVGCQQCAKSCSYGAITMVPFEMIDPVYLAQRKPEARGGRMYSVKCDNCAGYGDLACVSACPTGALFQIEGAALMDLLHDLNPEGTDAQVLDKLNPEPKPWLRIFAMVAFVLFTVVSSYEVLGRYFWPDFTFGEALFKLGFAEEGVLRDTEYPYRAGDTLSLTYGYMAVFFVVVGQLYRVRKALKFGGDLRAWLQIHIWLSLVGFVLAFWHMAFNLFSLIGVTWWSFAVAVGSGIVGTYLHTFVPKTISGQEMALRELQDQLARLTREIEGYYASARAALTAGPKKSSNLTTMTRVHDLLAGGGKARSPWLTGVFGLLLTDLASLKGRDELEEAAARRAGVTGERKAKLDALMATRRRVEAAITSYERIRTYTRKWYVIHKTASYVFFIALILHIGVELIW